MRFIGTLVLTACVASAAFASDVTSSFGSSNPNAGWSFGYRTSILSTNLTAFNTYSSLTGGGFGSLTSWKMDSGYRYLGAYKNTNAGNFDGGEGTKVPAGEFLMHPEGSAVAVARYTAPSTGLFDVTYSTARFGGANGAGANFTLVNNGAYVAGNLVPRDSTYSFNTPSTASVFLNAGQSLDFVVDNGGNGDDWDSTGLRANVQAVPEPTSLAALGAGALALLRRRKR